MFKRRTIQEETEEINVTDEEYERCRVDWRSMFVYCPNVQDCKYCRTKHSGTGLMRLVGTQSQRAEYSKVMFERKARYRALMMEYKKSDFAKTLERNMQCGK